MAPIIVVGAGMAAYALARSLRQRDAMVPLLLVTRDAGAVYAKPALSNGFAHGRAALGMVSSSAEQAGASLHAEVQTNTCVRRIDCAAGAIELDTGRLAYSSLVLATGARPVPLSLAGSGGADIMSINHLDDYVLLRQRLATAGVQARVTILGAGLVGCELADDLLTGGFRVTLIDPQARLLAALAAPGLSDALESALRERGLDVHLNAACTRLERAGANLRLTLDSGALIDTDLVIAAVGVRPALELARASGLATARGIVVDAFGRTSAPNVYALGDCAEYAGIDGGTTVLPYVAPMLAAARAIAATLSGSPTPIDLAPQAVMVKTPSCALALWPPERGLDGEWRHEHMDGRVVARFVDTEGIVRGWGLSDPLPALRQALHGELGASSGKLVD